MQKGRSTALLHSSTQNWGQKWSLISLDLNPHSGAEAAKGWTARVLGHLEFRSRSQNSGHPPLPQYHNFTVFPGGHNSEAENPPSLSIQQGFSLLNLQRGQATWPQVSGGARLPSSQHVGHERVWHYVAPNDQPQKEGFLAWTAEPCYMVTSWENSRQPSFLSHLGSPAKGSVECKADVSAIKPSANLGVSARLYCIIIEEILFVPLSWIFPLVPKPQLVLLRSSHSSHNND